MAKWRRVTIAELVADAEGRANYDAKQEGNRNSMEHATYLSNDRTEQRGAGSCLGCTNLSEQPGELTAVVTFQN